MKKAMLLAGVAALMAGVGTGVGLRAETLEDVLVSAYNSNPVLMARRAQLRATDEEVPQALSNWRPQVALSGELSRGRYEDSQYTGASSLPRESGRTGKSGALTVTQYLYRGGRTEAATRRAEADVLANRADLQVNEQTVLLNATKAYLDVARDEQVLALNVNNEQVLRRQLDAAQERFRVGEITRTDVSQAEARLAGAVADRAAASGTLQDSRATFITVVGYPAEAPQVPKSAVAVPAAFDEVKTMALEKNPSIVYADWVTQSAKDNIDLVRGELLPTVSLVGTASRGLSTSTMGVESDALEAALKVNVPIYQQGADYSRLRESKHTFGRRKIEADKARRDALETATRAWEDLQSTRSRIKSLDAQLRANELALAGVEEEAKVGSRTILDVLNAEQELFSAKVNMVRAQHDEIVASYTLKSALGQMTAEGLGLAVQVYDPTQNYNQVRDRWFGASIDEKYED